MLVNKMLIAKCKHHRAKRLVRRITSGRRSLVLFWIFGLTVCIVIIFVWLRMTFLSVENILEDDSNQEEIIVKSNAYMSALNISETVRNIKQYNRQQTVQNEVTFGPLQSDSVVIVVQVHDRIAYLEYLILSLSRASDISRALVIFSHDFYDEEINSMVQSITFCKVIQIFYPYSIQLHPHVFPGQDPNDCPKYMNREEALIKKCNNALFPDLYGHYREANYTQTKHHWWWKANFVFNHLEVTRNHSGLVLFLEDDHFVTEDFIYMLKLMEGTSLICCRHCNVFTLGRYSKNNTYFDQVETTPWIGGTHNMGMAFNKTTWMQIIKCRDYFCKYDDYNWDWSLQHVSQNCLKQPLHAMVVKGSRVFHIGKWCIYGIHHKNKKCGPMAAVSEVINVIRAVERRLYPVYINLADDIILKKKKLGKCNGGWGDHRDHMLCMDMLLRG